MITCLYVKNANTGVAQECVKLHLKMLKITVIARNKMNTQISSKARKKDNAAKPRLADRQKKRKFLEQLDDMMAAINCELTGSLRTVHNRTIASK